MIKIFVENKARNGEVLAQYNIPYQSQPGGFLVEFTSKEDVLGKPSSFGKRFVLDWDETYFFTYAPFAGCFVPQQKRTLDGRLKVGDRIQPVGGDDSGKAVINSISPPRPDFGMPYEWVGYYSGFGSYGSYAHKLELVP